jgi:hypothetical protein
VVVGGEDGAGADWACLMFGHRPGDRLASEGRLPQPI